MDFILNPFVTLLTWLYATFGNNMVLAIFVFTVLVRLAMYPLMARQLRSSIEMQQVQPKLKEIQEKYKNDREKLAQEQMKLYREHGINPFGGCLPILIQFPIWAAILGAIQFALATTPTHLLDLSGRLLIPGLGTTIPLDNRFLGMNLTQPPNLQQIPAIVLLALVAVTTWYQMKISMPKPQPTADGKPDQAAAMSQSMTTILPVMYVFLSLSYTIGLSIYILVSNLISIVQTYIINRQRKALQEKMELASVAIDTKNKAKELPVAVKEKDKKPVPQASGRKATKTK
ncbi:MAG: YidC/Oxa1 family membrane protein insertase [Chloroflexota bacterium]|nr:YidC/Oxa1 family membrane protein insertase [Chloroflexota bacterium]